MLDTVAPFVDCSRTTRLQCVLQLQPAVPPENTHTFITHPPFAVPCIIVSSVRRRIPYDTNHAGEDRFRFSRVIIIIVNSVPREKNNRCVISKPEWVHCLACVMRGYMRRQAAYQRGGIVCHRRH